VLEKKNNEKENKNKSWYSSDIQAENWLTQLKHIMYHMWRILGDGLWCRKSVMVVASRSRILPSCS